ncbi:MAG: NAD(+)/NADH kinase [Planctomycetes bacterium]|nr:NAD(+)/NADH kinase [Planctomycetota bacterium]
MPTRIIVLINAGAGIEGGGDSRRERVERAFAAGGATPEIHVVEGRQLTAHARSLASSGAEVVVAAGGDGTVNAVAHALVGRRCALGVLPMGTLNHFAMDLGLAADLEQAAATIISGSTRAIDVGEVSGRYFINNSSIGLYPTIVSDRERQRSELGRRKYVAMAIAAWHACRHLPLVRVRISLVGHRVNRLLPFVFIGNNRYSFQALPLGRRERLDGGRLWFYVPVSRSRFGLVKLMLFALLGRLHRAKELIELPVRDAVVSPRQRHVEVGIDGELVRMRSPLHFRIHPLALKVIVPGPVA